MTCVSLTSAGKKGGKGGNKNDKGGKGGGSCYGGTDGKGGGPLRQPIDRDQILVICSATNPSTYEHAPVNPTTNVPLVRCFEDPSWSVRRPVVNDVNYTCHYSLFKL